MIYVLKFQKRNIVHYLYTLSFNFCRSLLLETYSFFYFITALFMYVYNFVSCCQIHFLNCQIMILTLMLFLLYFLSRSSKRILGNSKKFLRRILIPFIYMNILQKLTVNFGFTKYFLIKFYFLAHKVLLC